MRRIVDDDLEDDDPGAQAPLGERALGLVRGYKRDLDRNRAVRAVRHVGARFLRTAYVERRVRRRVDRVWRGADRLVMSSPFRTSRETGDAARHLARHGRTVAPRTIGL